MRRLAAIAWFTCCLVTRLAIADDFDAAAELIMPEGVRLGMAVTEVKQMRAAVFEGPPASSPEGQPSTKHRTLMEVQNAGAPGHLAYWYLCSDEQVVGVIRTRSLAGVDAETAKSAAQQTYSQLVHRLGTAQQETLLRKGATAFVPVRADVWYGTEGGTAYFVATNQEMTVAVVAATDFPLGQVFIRPDAQRFPLEEPEKRSISDLERPVSIASTPPVPSSPLPASPAGTLSGRSSAEPVLMSGSPPLNQAAPASTEHNQWNRGRMLVAVFAGGVLIAVIILLLRWRMR